MTIFNIHSLVRFFSVITFLLIGKAHANPNAAPADSLKRKNIIYIVPTAVGGDLWMDLNNYWFQMGYYRFLNQKNIIGVEGGAIFKSESSKKSLTSNLTSLDSQGFDFAPEFKHIIHRNLYLSGKLFIQHTNTIREEEINKNEPSYYINKYTVIRDVGSFMIIFGVFKITKCHLFYDAGLGIGMAEISSSTKNKINPLSNLEREQMSNKIFDEGSSFSPKYYLHLKVGYNF